MIETLSPEQMLSIGQQIGWPQLGDVPAGEAGWREVADAGEQVLADLLEDGATVEPADVVVLRRVVCCTPDGPALLGAAAAKARRTLLASYPRDRLLTRAFSWLENLGFRLVGKRFRSYVHPPAELEEAAAGRGLTRSRVSRGLVWETAQYDAPSA